MIKGKLGFVELGGVTIAEMANWSYSGEVRDVIEAPEVYDSEYIEAFGGTLKGGDIEISGMLKIADAGQIALKTAFDANTESTDLKLYINATQYITPSDATTPASYTYVTKVTAIEHAASGVVMVSCSMKCSGQMVHATDA